MISKFWLVTILPWLLNIWRLYHAGSFMPNKKWEEQGSADIFKAWECEMNMVYSSPYTFYCVFPYEDIIMKLEDRWDTQTWCIVLCLGTRGHAHCYDPQAPYMHVCSAYFAELDISSVMFIFCTRSFVQNVKLAQRIPASVFWSLSCLTSLSTSDCA